MNKQTAVALLLFISFGMMTLPGCNSDGPMEEAGENVDQAMSDTGNAIEDACENVKESAGAEDSDC